VPQKISIDVPNLTPHTVALTVP